MKANLEEAEVSCGTGLFGQRRILYDTVLTLFSISFTREKNGWMDEGFVK
jgi:hypothetical protein